MPKYELEEETQNPDIDTETDNGLEDSTHPEIESNEEDASQEVSSEDEGTPEEAQGDGEQEGEEVEAVDENGDLIPDLQMPDPNAFELGNGLFVKPGDKVTPQILQEIQRGYQREAAFTKKCQEVAQVRDQANGVIETFNQVVANEHTQPALLFNHITPEHAIRALAAIGLDVDPKLLQSIGYGSSYRNQQQQGGYGQQVDPTIMKELQELKSWRNQTQQQSEQQQQIQALDAEVNSYIQDIKDPRLQSVLRRNILVSLGIEKEGGRSLREIALHERQLFKQLFSSKIAAKKNNRVNIGRSSGSSRPVGARPPQTFEEADNSARGRLGVR